MTLFSVVLLLAGAALFASAQDLVAVAPNNAKVEYEDARVRVVRLKLAPNETLPVHDRPQRVVVTLTANDVLLTMPDGTQRKTQVGAGNIAWSGAGKRSVQNLDTPLENIVIELKRASDPALRVDQKPHDPTAIVEPHHKWLFENQYVRVYDVVIPPRQMTELHRHVYDAVVVSLSGEPSSDQQQGGDWTQGADAKRGAVTVYPYASTPIVHRVRNDGNSEFRVALIELKQAASD